MNEDNFKNILETGEFNCLINENVVIFPLFRLLKVSSKLILHKWFIPNLEIFTVSGRRRNANKNENLGECRIRNNKLINLNLVIKIRHERRVSDEP